MAYNFVPYNQGQQYLLPPSIQDWVSKDSLARFVSDLIDQFDGDGKLEKFYSRYRKDGVGNTAYHPRMLVKVIVYGYCVGITSSRKMASALQDHVAFRFLSADQHPDYRTISDFRKIHLASFKDLFNQVLELCKVAGLVKMGRVALDGRRVQGNASLAKNRDNEYIKELVNRIFEEAERVDAEEDKLYGSDKRGDELPEHLRDPEKRMKFLKEASALLEEKERKEQEERERKLAEREREEKETGKKKRGRKPKKKADKKKKPKANLTDIDSRTLKTRKGWVQGYNGQAMADTTSQVIVAQDVTQAHNDVQELSPMIDKCKEQAGTLPKELVADAGYWSDSNSKLQTEDLTLFIATKKDWKQRKKLKEQGAPKGRIPKDADNRYLMERKLLTKAGKAAYKTRGPTIEGTFGQMVMRYLTRFWLRGIEKVKAEWSLWCTTHNILKLWRSGFAFGTV